MSPYQQDVIDATLQEFDIQAQKGLGQLQHKHSMQVHLVEDVKVFKEQNIKSASDRNRAALQAQLLQQGFGQAQQLAATTSFSQQTSFSWINSTVS